MGSKKKILFVNDEMMMGGVARVLNTLMANLDRDKYEIDCLILHKRGELLNEIPSDVNVLETSKFFNVVDYPIKQLIKEKRIFKIIKKLLLIFYMKSGLIEFKIKKERKKIIKKEYDIEVAAKEGFCTIFSAYGNSRKKINWVLTDYSVCNYSKNHMKLMKKVLKNIDLNLSDSKEAVEAYEKVFGVSNTLAIHNLMDTERVEARMSMKCDISLNKKETNVVVVARFHPQKNVKRVLLAHKKAIEMGIKHNLFIVGGGQEERMLKDFVKLNNLSRVKFLGYMSNPYALISKCDLFALSSEYEGFATIVNESLICHTPVLATKVSGISEQITKDFHGWICDNDDESFIEKYIDIICKKDILTNMKDKLVDYKYPNDKILEQFQNVL
ncbi:MAG: glycosyltransferase [Anaerorhabdus sp.]